MAQKSNAKAQDGVQEVKMEVTSMLKSHDERMTELEGGFKSLDE